MKRLSFLLFGLLILTTNMYTQNVIANDSHLQFKSISISGKLPTIVRELTNIGYKLSEQDNECALFKGNFVNESCLVLVSTTPKSKEVYKISVLFEKKNNWYTLKSDYTELKSLLKTKYNVNPNSTEFFSDPYYEGDGYELSATSNGKCFYFSTYKLDNGEITLAILDRRIIIEYEDNTGRSLNEHEESNKALDDL